MRAPSALATDPGVELSTRDVFAVLRPEMLQIEFDTQEDASQPPTLEGEIVSLQYLGASVRYTVVTSLGPIIVDVPASNGAASVSPGRKAKIRLPLRAHIIPSDIDLLRFDAEMDGRTSQSVH